jgi:hypothetical protein
MLQHIDGVPRQLLTIQLSYQKALTNRVISDPTKVRIPCTVFESLESSQKTAMSMGNAPLNA